MMGIIWNDEQFVKAKEDRLISFVGFIGLRMSKRGLRNLASH
jgi:hypothetical protein